MLHSATVPACFGNSTLPACLGDSALVSARIGDSGLLWLGWTISNFISDRVCVDQDAHVVISLVGTDEDPEAFVGWAEHVLSVTTGWYAIVNDELENDINGGIFAVRDIFASINDIFALSFLHPLLKGGTI